MNNDDINQYLPSILNPRAVKKNQGNLTLTQNSITSRCSLSLRRNSGLNCVKKNLHKTFPTGKENESNNNNIFKVNSLNVQNVAKDFVQHSNGISCELAEKPNAVLLAKRENKSGIPKTQNLINACHNTQNIDLDDFSICFSAIEDINNDEQIEESRSLHFGYLEPRKTNVNIEVNDESVITLSSATELVDNHVLDDSFSTVEYEVTEKSAISVSFGFTNCDNLNVSTNNGIIKTINVVRKDNSMDVDCEIIEIESSKESIDCDREEALADQGPSPPKKAAIAVNLEFKKTIPTENATENSKVLILNTNAIERLSHVIVQPPNYKLVKRQISNRSKFKNSGKLKSGSLRNGTVSGDNLKQSRLERYLGRKSVELVGAEHVKTAALGREDVEMSKTLGVADAVKSEVRGRGGQRGSARRGGASPRAAPSRSPAAQPTAALRNSSSEQRGPQRLRNDSISSAPSPRKNADSVQFTLPAKTSANKATVLPKNIPYYKIVAGTHFAVDAFSYGEIPNVKHYFLTHFHSDHYSGLKKSFTKVLFCSQITADLCTSRLGVNPKCIRMINIDETVTVEGVEVTAVDANHCPGALMLVFTLPNGKTLLHTGDFRASPQMESYPVFWNKDIHTIYLDSTYCNPRYDFPTQDQSLEMALYHLRQKKLTLEKAGKKFASVLIVCGTYTIGKEKFFLGMARRVGCSVWACPEKDRVLQCVEGRSFCTAPPAACQLHVVPMRDLTIEKLRSYLESLQNAFTEVVAFKPSGWENGKNSTVEKDNITIHGIPYSEHSSFSEMIRFVKFLKPKQVVPTVDISGGVKAVQKYFPCPLVCKENSQSQSQLTDYFSIQNRPQMSAVT